MNRFEFVSKTTTDILDAKENAAIFVLIVEEKTVSVSAYNASVQDTVQSINALVAKAISGAEYPKELAESLNTVVSKMIARALLQATGQLEV